MYDDYDVGAVFALSDFDLEGILDYINVDINK